MKTPIGALNKRIALQYETKSADGMGGFIISWADAATIWAAIWPTSANEITAANSTVMIISHRIRIRHRGILKGSWRIRYGDKYYNIVSIVNPNMANEYLDIMCKEAA